MRRIIFMMMAGLWCLGAWSIPAKRIPFTVTNSDGTAFTLMLCGDECFHFYATTDGIPAVQEENGDWRLAPELADSISIKWTEGNRLRNAHRIQRATEQRARRVKVGQQMVYEGQKKGVVILVNFRDLSMKSTHTRAEFKDYFNKVGYSNNGCIGSVHDYFYDQSYGKFDLTFDVYGPVETKKNSSYYGANDSNGSDSHVAEFAAEVCTSASNQYSIDWSKYDWDGDGEVDQVYIIYAGAGEASGGGASSIWPHEWKLSEGKRARDGNGAITLGGVTIDTYATSDELRSSSSKLLNGIGTACHEFSHCLGLPDFYDTSYNGGFGMNHWDLMDAGSYNGNTHSSECPVGYTAYERWNAGWLDFIELTEPCTITGMPDLEDEPVAYIIRNEVNRNEYFTLENRQCKKWFQYVNTTNNCHGMLVCHVDFNQKAWEENRPNKDDSHQRMSIIPAGGEYGTLMGTPGHKSYSVSPTQYQAQLFPGRNNVTALTNDSHINCGGQLFGKNTDGTHNMNKPITNITESEDGFISFAFMGGGDQSAIRSLSPTLSEGEGAWYTLDGRKLSGKPTTKGIYLRGGKKIAY